MVLGNSVLLSVSKEDVTHHGFAAVQLMERHITVGAASGMLQQEVWRAKRQSGFLSLLQHPLDFVPVYFLLPKCGLGAAELCAGGAARRGAVGRKGSAQPCSSRAVQGFEQSFHQQMLSGVHRQNLALIQ